MKQIIYVDMDDVLCDFSTAHAKTLATSPDVPFPQSVPGFFRGLKPLPNAIECVNELRQNERVFVLTAPSTRNPLCYTEKRLWIEDHFDYDFTKRLIISPDKGLLVGDYLIDDNIAGKGQERFSGRLIHFGSATFPDWPAVMAALRQGL